jgi:hypothetical protein
MYILNYMIFNMITFIFHFFFILNKISVNLLKIMNNYDINIFNDKIFYYIW